MPVPVQMPDPEWEKFKLRKKRKKERRAQEYWERRLMKDNDINVHQEYWERRLMNDNDINVHV